MKEKLNVQLMTLALMALMAVGCHDEPIGSSFDDDLYVPIGALVSVSNVQTGFFDLGDPDNASIAFDLTSEGETLSTSDIEVSFNEGTPVPFMSAAAVPGTVTVTFDEALAAVGLTLGDMEVGNGFRFQFKTSTSSGTFRSSNTLLVAISCKSELAGTYDYVGSNNFCSSGDQSGQVTINEINAGEYTFSDWSFGSYQACYGVAAPANGSLVMRDVCNTISVGGADSYGDTWELTINEVNGPNLSVTYVNTYGEFSDAVITRTDGTDWPPLSN